MPVRSSKAFALDTIVLEMPCQIAVSVRLDLVPLLASATGSSGLLLWLTASCRCMGNICSAQVNTQNPIDSLRFWHFFLNLYVDIKPAIFAFT
jgi:hypothetical protein